MKHLEADVVVIALGPAGLAAAVQAAELGAKVVAFEKASTPGGAASMGMGPFAVESKLQKELMIGITKEEAFEKFMDYTHWAVDARLVRDYFWKSADTIDWLMSMGVEFVAPMKYYAGSEATWHVVKPEGGGRPGPRAASTMIKLMAQRAEELGVDMHMKTPAVKILKENGVIVGVIAREEETGEEIQVSANAVIVATGGFGDNPEWIKKYTEYEYGKDIWNFRIPGLVGDGIRMAWEVGAGKSNFDMEKMAHVAFPEGSNAALPFMQPNLIVNLSGDRIMNEEISQNGAVTANVIKRQQNRNAFMIIGDSILRHYKKYGVEWQSNVYRQDNPMENYNEKLEAAQKEAPNNIFIANSIEELAQQTGIDYVNLKNTIDEYNRCCAQNYDEYFNKSRKFLLPITGPKYYAGRMTTGAYGSLGGIKINYKTEVLTDDFQKIPGLYAAGTDACDIYAGTYLYYLPGNTMGFALNTGRIAAENAIEYLNSL